MRVLHLLIQKGAKVNAKSHHGTTALHLAAAKNDGKIINLLMNHGANPNISNSDSLTPIWLATYYSNFGAIDKLLCGRNNIH